MLKRDLELKDMGRLVPGHGGLLDRLDSLVLTAPAVYVVLTVVPARLTRPSPTREGVPAMTGTPVRLDLSSPSRGPRGKPPKHFVDLTPEQRIEAVTELGEKPFRAKQLATHYFTHLTNDPAQMTDLPKATRDKLVEGLFPQLLTAHRTQTADKGTTVKTLWHLFDGAKVESVLMRYANRTTLCVSSQAGCGLACSFCATGQLGLTRNLSTAEIVEQVRAAARSLADGEVPGGPTRLTQRRVHGHGRAAGQLQVGHGDGPPPGGPGARRPRHVGAERHGLDRRDGAGDGPASPRRASR